MRSIGGLCYLAAMRTKRTVAAALVGLCAAGFQAWIRARVSGFSDFDQIWLAARDVAHGVSPYSHVTPNGFPFFYPLPAAILGLPFALYPAWLAAALWTGLGFGVLAFGLTRDGWWRLVALCSLPAVESAQLAQWSPIVTAAWCIPALGFLLAAKPTAVLPISLGSVPRSVHLGAIGAALGLLAISFVVQPAWVAEWIGTVRGAHHFVPLVLRPGGVLLLLALIRWRRREAWLIVLMAVMPQAGMAYDALPVAVVPSSRCEALFLALCSFLAVPFRHVATGAANGFTDASSANALLYLATLYAPAVLLVLRHSATSEPIVNSVDDAF